MIDDIIPGDTSEEAYCVQLRAVAKLSMAQRVEMSCQMGDCGLSWRRACAGRHPDYDERSVQLATIRCMLGERLFHEVYPDVHVDP